MLRFFSLSLLCLSFSQVGFASQNFQDTLNNLQKQVAQVNDSVTQKIAKQTDATDQAIKTLRSDVQQHVTSLNKKVDTVQSESKTMVQSEANNAARNLQKVRSEFMAGLQALQKVVKDSHDQLNKKIQAITKSK